MSRTAKLTVNAAGLGPLSVEVIPEGGDPIGFTLSAGRTTHELSVQPGRYAVIARRLNGENLQRSVTVAGHQDETVALAQSVPDSPNEFMRPETMRGQVALGSMAKGLHQGVLKGLVADTLGSIIASALRVENSVAVSRSILPQLTLQAWGLSGEGASGTIEGIKVDLGPSFLKVRLPSQGLVLGLLDEEGFGPIVVAPPFRQPLEITFVAQGVATRAAARRLNPSGQRTPVALVTPTEPAIGDLLAALDAPIVEQASAIWEQNLGNGSVMEALRYLERKFQSPAEALIGAHYLLRFMPQEFPIQWADNLVRAYPDAADGPVVAAWLRLSGGQGTADLDLDRIDNEVEDLLAKALDRPVTLFARTRRLLVEGLRLGSSAPAATRRSGHERQPAEFLDYGAYAGGLEAFWGTGPSSPGPHGSPITLGHELARVALAGSTFAEVRSATRFEAPQRALGDELTSTTSTDPDDADPDPDFDAPYL